MAQCCGRRQNWKAKSFSETVALLKNRNRLVSFRLAPDEFTSVVEACVSMGARSVSDFARQALLSRVQCGDVSLEGDLVTIARRLKEVESALETARALIARALGGEAVQGLGDQFRNGNSNGNSEKMHGS